MLCKTLCVSVFKTDVKRERKEKLNGPMNEKSKLLSVSS